MKIGILGATSQIATDFILNAIDTADFELVLSARRPESVREWLSYKNITADLPVLDFDDFSNEKKLDVLINFIGVGTPQKTSSIGASILEVTEKFDGRCLNYLKNNPATRYIYLSSGAAFGSVFSSPVSSKTLSKFDINNLSAADWYGISKLCTEAKHRAHGDLFIVDLRVYSYVSHTQSLAAGFFFTEMLRSIIKEKIFRVTEDNFYRDYIHPIDFFSLVKSILFSPPTNAVLDCYSKAPARKIEILAEMSRIFGLKYELVSSESHSSPTGEKFCYYSENKKAGDFGYFPALTSLDAVISESGVLLDGFYNNSNG